MIRIDIHPFATSKTDQRDANFIGHYFRTVAEKKLIEIFLYQKSRTVNKAGIMTLEGIEFEVESLLKHKRVELRYNPFDLSWVNVYYRGQFFQKARPFVIKRWGTKDKPPASASEPNASSGIKPLAQLAKRHQQQQQQQAACLTGHMSTANQQFFAPADLVQFWPNHWVET